MSGHKRVVLARLETLLLCNKLGVQLVPRKRGALTHEHIYTDVDGEVLYAVRRFEDGTARFLTPTAGGKWKLGLNGVRRVPYQLPELVKADVIVITEGEKKADVVKRLGLLDANGKPVAVTCTGGADSWRPEYVEYFHGLTPSLKNKSPFLKGEENKQKDSQKC